MATQSLMELIISEIDPKAAALISGSPLPPSYPGRDSPEELSPAINSLTSDGEHTSVPNSAAQAGEIAPLEQVPETRDELIYDALVNGT